VASPETTVRSGLDPLGLIQEEHLRRARPPADLRQQCDDDNDEDHDQEDHHV